MHEKLSQWVAPYVVISFFAYKNNEGKERITVYTTSHHIITFCDYWAKRVAKELEQQLEIEIEFEDHH